MKRTFHDDVREFAFSRMDKVRAEHLSGDERHENARRAVVAFGTLLKTKVTGEVGREVYDAYLELEALINARLTLSEFLHYWQGVQDGLAMSQADAKALFDADPEVEQRNRQRDREAVEKMERAAANGGAKVGA